MAKEVDVDFVRELVQEFEIEMREAFTHVHENTRQMAVTVDRQA